MHLTFTYLVYFIFGQSRRIKSFLFLACYALSCVVVSGYWYLYSIKPSLVDPFIYTAYDLDYFVNLFIHGGNVLVLTWHGYTLEDFKPIHMYRLVRTDTIWIITYVSIQKASRMITGKAVYGFLDAMSYTQLVVFYFALYLIAIVIKIIVLKVIYYKLNIKIEKIM